MIALRWSTVINGQSLWSWMTWGLTVLHVGHHVETGTPCDILWQCNHFCASQKKIEVFQMGAQQITSTHRRTLKTNLLKILQWWFCRRRPSVSELLSQMQAVHQHKRQRVFGGDPFWFISEFRSILHIWSDRGQMLDVKTTLRRFSLRGCANSNKCSWRTAKAPVTRLRRDWFDGLFRRTPEPGWVFAGQTQGIAPSRHHRVQESVPQMLSTSTEVTEILFISHVFFSNDFFNLKSIWTKGYCWSFDM